MNETFKGLSLVSGEVTCRRYVSELPRLKRSFSGGKGDRTIEAASRTTSVSHILKGMPLAVMEKERSQPDWPSATHLASELSAQKNVIQIWSILESCLAYKEFARAETLLNSLYEACLGGSAGTFMEGLNKYLQAWSQQEHITTRDIEQFVWKIPDRYHGMAGDSRTVAILIRNSIERQPKHEDLELDDGVFMTGYKKYLKAWKERGCVSEVLQHVDVLGVYNLKKIVEEQQIDILKVPREYRSLIAESYYSHGILVNQVKEVLEEDGEAEKEPDSGITKSLEKLGLSELTGVDSFGLKIIRHSLLALNLKLSEPFKKFLSELDSPEKYINGNSINFFEIYRNLPSEEERAKFNQILSEFNEDRQKQLEARSIEGAERNWKYESEKTKKRGTVMIGKGMSNQMWLWYQDLLPLVQQEVELAQRLSEFPEGLSRTQLYKEIDAKMQLKRERVTCLLDIVPFIRLVLAEKMAVITIMEILRLNSTGGVYEGMRSARAVLSVGRAVENEYKSQRILSEEKFMFDGISEGQKSARLKRLMRLNNREDVEWTQDVRAKLGSALISLLIKVAKVEVVGKDPRSGEQVTGRVPAISHSYQYVGGNRLGVLKLHKNLILLLGLSELSYTIFPQSFPMLVSPRPWSTWNDGGYQFSQNQLIRTKDAPEQLAYLKVATKRAMVDKVYQGLNVLGETAWTINQRVLAVLTTVWNRGEAFLEIPKNYDELKLPAQPPRSSDPSIKRNWQRECKRLANEFAKNRSMRCDNNYKLEIARALAGEKFYLPHNLDFRGRAYPIPPHFNHIGNDLSRGLLVFWEGKELGEGGLRWLKIHIANLFGHLKRLFEERVAFCEEHLDEFRKTAAAPLDAAFWQLADDPWQALAAIYELTDALALPDPTKFVSRQPVHTDGTCNGLQHYAALGGDTEGANQVNLLPHDRPRDVYAHVAELTKTRIARDMDKPGKVAAVAKRVLPLINRKVVKQTVMTNVYGVTFMGAKLQIEKQLKDSYESADEAYSAALYVTRHVFDSVRSLFEGAHHIQDWLSLCAKRITKLISADQELSLSKSGKFKSMASVIWTTKLGMPVVQPYRKPSKKQVLTSLQSVYISDPFQVNGVYSLRQVTAFPPNFIHSLDGTHMLMTAIESSKQGLTFASVHDSYWSHASSLDTLNRIIRDSFVELHLTDLIDELREEFVKRYKNHLLYVRVRLDHPAYQRVKAWRQSRTLDLFEEVELETTRQKLLAGTPEEREQGLAMDTSVSIVSAEEAEDLISHDANFDLGKSTGIKRTEVEEPGSEPAGRCLKQHGMMLVPMAFPKVPAKGEFDVNLVKESKYFFS